MEETAYEFDKGNNEIIRARISEFNGQTRADLRIFFKDAAGNWHPTKRGISFPVDKVTKLKEAAAKLEEASKNTVKN